MITDDSVISCCAENSHKVYLNIGVPQKKRGKELRLMSPRTLLQTYFF